MNNYVFENIELSYKKPTICISIFSETKDDILDKARKISQTDVSLVEWRCDFYEHINDIDNVLNTLKEIKSIVKEKHIIFTIRTLSEGGTKDILPALYDGLNLQVAKSGLATFIDIELSKEGDTASVLMEELKTYNVYVIGSFHNTQSTPSSSDISEKIQTIYQSYADIVKVVYFAQNENDLERLMKIAKSKIKKSKNKPIIAISMGELGIESRYKHPNYIPPLTYVYLDKSMVAGQLHYKEITFLLKNLYID